MVGQHKDDSVGVLLDIVIIVLVFGDHDGSLQIDAPVRERLFGERDVIQ